MEFELFFLLLSLDCTQMKRIVIGFLLCVTCMGNVPGQEIDTLRVDLPFENNSLAQNNSPAQKNFINAPYSGFVVPAALVSYGLLAQHLNGLHQLDVSTHRAVNEHFTGKIHADAYIQYVPAVAVFGVDILGGKAKHNVRDRAFLTASSYLISSASVHAIKRASHVRRPDDSNNLSFPSGHTATAFVGAYLLFKEYKDTSPWIGIAGFAVAGTTGAIRIYNQRHWVSDVVAGAGFGMLSVEISYLLLPAFHRMIGVSDSPTSITIAPVIGDNHYGVGFACTF